MAKPVEIRVPVRVKLDVKASAPRKRKRPELDADKAADFAKKEALRKLRGRTYGERF